MTNIPTRRVKNNTTKPTSSNSVNNSKYAASSDDRLIKATRQQLPLGRKNFMFMIAAGILIVVGFLLMLGPGSTPEQFNPDIFSTRRIIVGPTLAFLGFVAMGVAIIIKPTPKEDTPTQEPTSATEPKQ